MSPLFFLGWFVSIFIGFTFTHAADFLPLSVLCFGIAAIGLRRYYVSKSRKPSSPSAPARTVLLALTQWPLIPDVALFFLALEARKLLGHFPLPHADPWELPRGGSRSYDFWFGAIPYAEATAGACMILFFLLFLNEWESLTPKFRYFVFWCFLAAVVLFYMDVLQLYDWRLN